MSEFQTNWTKDELIAYILLYAAKADYIETKEEQEIVLARVSKERFDKIHNELDNDNDYVSVQKISDTMHEFNFSNKDIEAIISEIKALFLSDGNFDVLEQNLFRGLKRLLHQ